MRSLGSGPHRPARAAFSFARHRPARRGAAGVCFGCWPADPVRRCAQTGRVPASNSWALAAILTTRPASHPEEKIIGQHMRPCRSRNSCSYDCALPKNPQSRRAVPSTVPGQGRVGWVAHHLRCRIRYPNRCQPVGTVLSRAAEARLAAEMQPTIPAGQTRHKLVQQIGRVRDPSPMADLSATLAAMVAFWTSSPMRAPSRIRSLPHS